MRVTSKFAASALLLCLSTGFSHAREDVRIVNEGGIGDRWMLADGVQLAAPGYPAQYVDKGDSVCLAMGYAIKPDGTTSDFSLLKSWNSGTGEEEPADGYWDTFARAGANALSQWKFKPRPEVSEPVTTYTVATLFFNGLDGLDTNALKQHCKVADLKALIESNAEQGLDWAQRRDLEQMRYRMRRPPQPNSSRPRPPPQPRQKR